MYSRANFIANRMKTNKISKKEYDRKRYLEKRDTILKRTNSYNKMHREERQRYFQAYYKINKKQVNKKNIKRYKQRLKTDINFKLAHNLRVSLVQALKKNFKSGSAVKDLGCSITFLKIYLQSKFYDCMSWDNYGSYWEIDHIEELHTFDLTNRKQFLRAVHYTNLQPLTIEDHEKKTNRVRNNEL